MPVNGVEFPLGIDTVKFYDAMEQFIKIYLPSHDDTTVDTNNIDWIGDPARFDAFMREVAAGSDEVELGGGGAYFKFAMVGERANLETVPNDKQWSDTCRKRATQEECNTGLAYGTLEDGPNCLWDSVLGACYHYADTCPAPDEQAGRRSAENDDCEPTNTPLILCNPYYRSSDSDSDSDSDSGLGAGAIAGIAVGAAVVVVAVYLGVAYNRKMWPFTSGASIYTKIGSIGTSSNAGGRVHLLHF